MYRVIILLLMIISFPQEKQALPDLVGKWKVESLNMAQGASKTNQKEKAIIYNQFVKYFSNATFEFKADYHCFTSVKMPEMPLITYWKYNATKNQVELKTAKNDDSLIMAFEIIEKNGDVFFAMSDAPLVMKMRRLSN
ncbi:hypothetical protein [Mucilaginibacter auburnensis]|uniref:Lipocalin-like protein n=1 Tax=Mucilaginibacter auburnensis TaxID=1457233 RepID=A0A2H9VMS8_9SPHI|nr:hypothetical protein [Mucilaginibacter auburnensis]PJJ79625.1 hypothetical protein CLV57_2759 [Mucilaginibacter auburnensis]